MLFNSLDFAIFFPVVFILYWLVSKNLTLRNLLILVSRYIDSTTFLVRGQVYKEDYNKRPTSILNTDKDKIFWQIKSYLMEIDNKKYILLDLNKKVNIERFINLNIFTKVKNKFDVKNGFQIKEAQFLSKKM